MENTTCLWYETGDMWESECGVAWYFDGGGTPTEHEMIYCYKCGKLLTTTIGEEDAT